MAPLYFTLIPPFSMYLRPVHRGLWQYQCEPSFKSPPPVHASFRIPVVLVLVFVPMHVVAVLMLVVAVVYLCHNLTQGALTAEVNRLRVSLFPSTKTKDYTLPSDVIRSDNKRSKDSEIVDGSIGSTDDFGETDEAEFDLNKTEDKVEWKSALIGGDWDETVARFEEMVRRVSTCVERGIVEGAQGNYCDDR